jgi:UDP-N-acetylmuramoyl-L-alanyl-D-glutamate--2,6-diaminopimelate ligase
VGGQERSVERTTPEAIDLQRELREMLDGGDRACAMEVSSHALVLGRTRGIGFAAAVFTNLTQDHLDYHPTMEDYYQAKRALFVPVEDGARPGVSVVNIGDPYGERLAQELDGVRTFAVEAGEGGDGGSGRSTEADYYASAVRCGADGCRFTLHTPEGGKREMGLPMVGRFNVANAVGALAAVHALTGCDLDTLVAVLEGGVRVPGRFESVDEGQEMAVIVDYAHTPDSLENVLRAAREIARGRVVCVFGAGGDRDRGKRPLMGEIAGRLADMTIVTSDNPRSEDPEAIVAEIVAGVERREAVEVEVDRRKAIAKAIAVGRGDDVVVIAGKGHEQGQEISGGEKVAFDDVTVAREALNDRLSKNTSAGAQKTAVGAGK